MLRIFLVSIFVYALLMSQASAEPISLVTAVFTNALIAVGAPAAIAGIVGTGIAYAATVTAGIFLSSLLTPQQSRGSRQNIDPGQYKSTFSEAESSEINAVGTVRLGGLKAFGNTSGTQRYRVICSVRGPVVEVLNYYFDGRVISVDSDGYVVSSPYARPGADSWVRIQEKMGDGTETAWSELITVFPDFWTSAHRLRGIGQALIQYTSPGLTSEKWAQLFQNGAPELEREMKVGYVYDPRLDSTVTGGSGSQRSSDESTWDTWTDNGPLCAAHVMRRDESLSATDFNWELMIAEADKADALVSAQGGTQKRSRCSGVWPSESSRGDVMQQLLDSIGAEVRVDDSNLIYIALVDDTRTSELSLTKDDVVRVSWKSGPEAVDRPNICRVKYYSPERNYDMFEIEDLKSWASFDDEIAQYGKKYFDVVLPFCISSAQAQRIARRLFELERADRGTLETSMVGLAAWGKRVIEFPLQYDDEGLDFDTLKVLIEPPRVDDEEGRVEIPYRVLPDLSVWTPDTHEAPAPDALGGFAFEGALATPATPSRIVVVDKTPSQEAMRVQYADLSAFETVEAVYRLDGGAWTPMTEYDEWAETEAVVESTDVEVRVRVFDGNQNSEWSPIASESSIVFDTTVPSGTNLTLSDDDNGTVDPVTVTISIECRDINFVEYTVERQDDGGGYSTIVSATDLQPFTLTQPQNTVDRPAGPGSTTVDYRVKFFNSTGQSSELTESVTIAP